MKRSAPVVLLLLLASCAAAKPTVARSGSLLAGGAIVLHGVRGSIEAYSPAAGEPKTEYTVEYYGPAGTAPAISQRGNVVTVVPAANAGSARYLIRAPIGATLDLSTLDGPIDVQDVDAVVNARTGKGAIDLMVQQYANAQADNGNVQATFASKDWSGTLRFGTIRGDATIYANAQVRAHVHLHVDDGSIFTDFPLRGTSSGKSETIDANLNGGAPRTLTVTVHQGVIRLLQLKPQP